MTQVGAEQDKGYRDILKSIGRTGLPVLLGEGILFGLAELLVPFSPKLPEINPDPGLRL
jgi:hypothetical protein